MGFWLTPFVYLPSASAAGLLKVVSCVPPDRDAVEPRPCCPAGPQAPDVSFPSACLAVNPGLPLPQKAVYCGLPHIDTGYSRPCVTLLVSGLPALWLFLLLASWPCPMWTHQLWLRQLSTFLPHAVAATIPSPRRSRPNFEGLGWSPKLLLPRVLPSPWGIL